MFQALRIRDFRLLWGGSLVSSLGSWLLILAVPAHVLMATGSLRDSGLTLAVQYAPALVMGPVAGVLADRWDRRRLMIAADLVCAGAVAGLLLGLAPGRLWVLYVALIAESSGNVLFASAMQALTPAVVGTGPLLTSANSLLAGSDGVVRLIGGPLGGILLGVVGIRWLIVADALSYLISAAAIALMPRTPSGVRTRRVARAIATDLAGGIRALRNHRVAAALLPVTVMFLAANASLSAVLVAFGVRRLGGTGHTGFLLSCLGVGFLLGAPMTRMALDRVQPRTLLAATLSGTAAGYLTLFTAPRLALPAAVSIGMFGSMSQMIPLTTVQRVVPDSVLGRVCAVFLTGEAAATLTGSVAGPIVAQAAQFAGLAAVASALTVAAAVLTLLVVPAVPIARRHWPRLACGPPESSGARRRRERLTDDVRRGTCRLSGGRRGHRERAIAPGTPADHDSDGRRREQ
jgi:MFS family permease